MRIGVIGTGMMGAQLAIRLAKSRRGVVVFSRDRSKAQIVQHSIAGNKIRMASTPAEIGNNSRFVIVCVKDHQAILDVTSVKGDAGLIDSPRSDRTDNNMIFIQTTQKK